MSTRFYDVGTSATPLLIPPEGATVQNAGPGSLSYGSGPGITAETCDGMIGVGSAMAFVDPVWGLSATHTRVAVSTPPPEQAYDAYQHLQFAPDKPFRLGAMVHRANESYFVRFTPENDSILTGIQVMPAVHSAGDPTVSFGIYDLNPDGGLRRLAVVPDGPGRINMAPDTDFLLLNRFSIGLHPRLAVRGCKPYYASVRLAADPTLALVSAKEGSSTPHRSYSGFARALCKTSELRMSIDSPSPAYEAPLDPPFLSAANRVFGRLAQTNTIRSSAR